MNFKTEDFFESNSFPAKRVQQFKQGIFNYVKAICCENIYLRFV